MAINYFLGWTQADLEAELVLAQKDFAAGKSTTMASDGSVVIKSAVDTRAQERIRRILLALNQLAPQQYPLSEIVPITQTRVVFS